MESISIGRARLPGPWHSACQALHADSGKRNLFIEVYRRFRVRVPALDERSFARSIASHATPQPRLLISFRFTIDRRSFTIRRTLILPLSIIRILHPAASLLSGRNFLPNENYFFREVAGRMQDTDLISGSSSVSKTSFEHRQSPLFAGTTARFESRQS